MSDKLTTADMLFLLNRQHKLGVRYQRFWRAIVGGEVPAHRGQDGRSWEFDPADVPSIVAHFRAAEPMVPLRPTRRSA